MEQSENIGDLAAAMVAAAAKLRDVAHDAQNAHLRNRYATLEAVLGASRPVLADAGLILTQWIGGQLGEGQRISVTTQITHAGGQWVRSTVEAVIERQRGCSLAQSGGVQITYLRRYAALAALGLATADDVDGHVDVAPSPPKWNDAERKAFHAQLAQLGVDYEGLATWCEEHNRPRPSRMGRDRRNALLLWLRDMERAVRGDMFG